MKVIAVLCLLVATALAAPDWGVRRDPFDAAVVARYRALLARDPHDPILGRLVALYRQHRTLAELRALYDRDDWASLVVRARLERGRDAGRAIALLSRATRQRPDDHRAWIALAELQRPLDAPAAREAYRTALDLAPPPAAAVAIHTALSELALAAGDLDDAERQLRALIGLDPSPARWLAHGDAIVRVRPAEALASYRAAEQRSGDPSTRLDAITRQATALAGAGEHAHALIELHRALALAPRGSGLASELMGRLVDEARAGNQVASQLALLEAAWPAARRDMLEHVTLGELYEANQAPSRAIAAYEAAIARAPREPRPARRLVALLERLGRTAEALARFEAFARQVPADPAIQLELARRYGTREPQATATLEALSRSRPRDADVHAAIADFYVQRAQLHGTVADRSTQRAALRAAAAAYRRAAKLDPSYRSSLAKTYGAAGDRAGMTALARETRDPQGLAEIANVMLEYAMWDEARDTFSTAISREPNNPAPWSGRAGAYEGLEEWAAAAADAARALGLSVAVDAKALEVLRHVVVRDVLRLDKIDRYWRAWRTQLAREPAHRDLAALLAELEASERVDPVIQLTTLRELHTQFPHDLQVASELIQRLFFATELGEALPLVRWFAAQPAAPAADVQSHRRLVAEFRERLRVAAREHARDAAWLAAGLRVGTLVDVAPPREDTTRARLRVGLRLALGAGEDGRLLRLGATATRQLAGGLSLAGRLDWTQTSTARGPGGSLGLIARLSESPRAAWFAGGGARVDALAAAPLRVTAEAGVDAIARYRPLGAGLRIGRTLGGGTTASLELVVEWR